MSKKTLTTYFKNVILMSGTPDAKQKDLTRANSQNVCECSPRIAMENGWICKPSLNLVNCADIDWPSAVKAVYERELKLYDNGDTLFMPVILVNCKSIDDIANLRELDWFKHNAGNAFDFISIHSNKAVNDDDGNIKTLTAEINNVEITSEEAYAKIEDIDNNEITKPIIVAQVQMIGEGINVKSFTSVITSTNSDKTAMQQIGRALRNKTIARTVLEKKKLKSYDISKVENGHANVYVIQDNLDTITSLISDLNNFELTDDCFSWGDKIDIKGGSSPEILETEESCKLEKNRWLKINSADPEIIEIVGRSRKRCLDNTILNFKLGGDVNDDGVADKIEFEKLTNKKTKEGFVEVWTKRKTMKSDELFTVLLKRLVSSLENPTMKMLWTKSSRAVFNIVFQDIETANFFEKHLKPDFIRQLAK
jgi:hypothetical protein